MMTKKPNLQSKKKRDTSSEWRIDDKQSEENGSSIIEHNASGRRKETKKNTLQITLYEPIKQVTKAILYDYS